MILVTGGTGFLGRHLVRHFASCGTPVRVLSRTPPRVALPAAVECLQGDLAEPAALARAVDGIETVVHAAAMLEAQGAADWERINVAGTAALARACRASGVRRFIHVSSAGVYGDGTGEAPHRETDAPGARTPYERSKLAAERALAEALAGSSIACTVLRPTGLYGPERAATAAFFREVARKRLWLHGPARVIVHPTHVDDAVLAVRLALDRGAGGETFNVGGERALPYPELIAEIGRRVGARPLQVRLPAFRSVNRAVDIGSARAVLGFAPRTLAGGLDETAAALRGTVPPP